MLVYITSYELIAMNNVIRSTDVHTLHITGICPWTNMPGTLHIYVALHFYYSLHWNPTLQQISIKINKLQHLFTILLQNICQQHIFPQMSHICHITKWLHMYQWGSIPIYICYMLSCSHQWCSQNGCTQTTITIMPMPLTMMKPTTTMMYQPN